MEYFYVPPSYVSPPHLTIDGEEFQHLSHVMRKEPGDEIRVVDGKGNVYDVRIIDIVKREARCEITAHRIMENEPNISVTLAAGIVKNGARFDFLVEKATELGVRSIVPLATERTIPQHAKTERWQKLAIAAMKQSGRCVLPRVLPLTPFSRFIAKAGDAGAEHVPSQHAPFKLIPHEKETARTLREALASGPKDTVLCIGPEGGFSDQEVDQAVQAGFLPVSLGPRRLRTETATLAALAMVLT
ncbi:16S rRNA (uracil(1498)-N(3))-methyltransferase [bacterium]|nr:MAG: 16S rRNA (uracil(1498)-N(3))-methyltransferase [bacterium]